MRIPRIVAFLLLVLTVAAPTLGMDIFLVNVESANAFFEHVDGCINTTVVTSVSKSAVRNPPPVTERSAFLSLIIFSYDQCTGAQLGMRIGSDFMSSFTFDVNQTVDEARLIGSVTVFDQNGASSVVSVDLAWTHEGPLTRMTRRRQFRIPGSMFVSRITGLSRDASATGTVLDGGTNVVPLPSIHADMGREGSGTISTGRP